MTATAAYCWGDNGYGQLGTGNEHPSAVPVAVAGGETFASVSAGDGFTCGVTTSGEGYCWGRSVYWGRNEEGQLGDGTLRVPVRPARVREPDSTVD